MPAIYPIGTERISDLLLQKRVMSQFAYNRSELVRLQDQLASGYRITTPSQDAPAAVRAIALQRLLEQKDQARINLTTSQSYVNMTESALADTGDLLIRMRGQALAAVDSTTSPEQRRGMMAEVEQAIEQFVQVGNQQFRGRYLFSGSTTNVQPFELDGSYVIYRGNEGDLSSYVDVGFLADTNLTGEDVFGAFSPEMRGTADLAPILTAQTRLADLPSGAGVELGSIRLSDGSSARTIDLSGAETVGDVAGLIEANPPAGRAITVEIGATGLIVDIDDAGGGNLTIKELTGGTTAAALGILETVGTGVGPIVGRDLDPRLLPATKLSDMLGVRANTMLESAGVDNDIAIEASSNGDAWNGVQVRYVTVAAVGDQALANYDPATKTLEIDIRPGETRATTVVAAVNATGLFNARLDSERDANNNGSGVVDVTANATLAGGSGITLDQESGLQIVNKGQTYTITFEDAETIEDLLNRLNHSEADVLATINADGTGIDVRSRVSGADFSIGENGGSTAADLGIRSFTRETLLGDLNYGAGVEQDDGTDFVIQRKDGTTLDIDVGTARTVGDILDLINGHPDNVGDRVEAQLTAFGNGIELYDANAAGPETLSITRSSGTAAWDLGLIARGQDQATAEAAAGGEETLLGNDANPLEVASVFTSLIRLRDALADFDLREIERSTALLDDDFQRLNFARAELGVRGRTLDTILTRIEQEEVELRSTLSLEIDADVVAVISELAARQASMEAAARLIGQTMQLSLLQFL